MILYKTYIRHTLEFVIQTWSPYLDRDIKLMKKIKGHAAKMDAALGHLEYYDRINKLVFLVGISGAEGRPD